MFGRRRNPFTSAVTTTLALAGIALLGGCADLARAPLAPEQPAAVQPEAQAQHRASKPVATAGSHAYNTHAFSTFRSQTATGWFARRAGGALAVDFSDYAQDHQVQVDRATFAVKAGSLDKGRAQISMTVTSGTRLSDVEITFGPSGVVFNPHATLTLVLKGKLTAGELEALKSYHYHHGATTQISHSVSSSGDNVWTIILDIPGFSRYSLGGDGYMPDEDEM